MIRHDRDHDTTFTFGNSPAAADEYFLSLLRNLPWPALQPGSDQAVKTVGFTSCQRGEGVSSVSIQTACAAASFGEHQILIVDGNLNNPSLDQRFGLESAPGLVECLIENCEPDAAIRNTSVTNLAVLPVGTLACDPVRVYGLTERLRDVFSNLSRRFDLIVVDLPAIGSSDLALPLLVQLDGVALVVESDVVPSEVIQGVSQKLHRAGIQLLGVVLNKQKQHMPNWLHRLI